MQNINKRYRALFYILLIVQFIIIFIFSMHSGETSKALSEGIVEKIINVFFKNIPSNEVIQVIHICIRKLAHFSLYFLVGIFSILLLATYNLKDSYRVLISLFIGIIYAALDEFHQIFVEDRAGKLFDVVIDSFGVVFGICIVLIIMKIYKIKKIKN